MAQVGAMVDGKNGKLEERVARLERLVEALLNRPLRVEVVVPERSMGGCGQAELYRLADLIYYETCEKEKGDPGTCKRLLRVLNTLKEWSMDELRSKLGV